MKEKIMKSLQALLSFNSLFWLVYIGFLFVLWPQAAWTVDQFQDATTQKFSLMGVQATLSGCDDTEVQPDGGAGDAIGVDALRGV